MPRASKRYTIRFVRLSDGSLKASSRSGFDYLESAMLAAWEVVMGSGRATEAVIYHDNTYVGKLGKDGRLFDAELRQIGLCITPTEAKVLV